MANSSSPDERSQREAQEDELVAIRCQLGESAAFDDLVARWHEPLWRYVRRVTGSDDQAADIVQDVWLRVVRGITRLREPNRLRAWLFGIARRAVMDRLREKYAEPTTVSADVPDVAMDPSTDLEAESAALHEELEHLPVVDRDALVLFYLQELTLAEMADVLGIPIGTVKSRLFKARHALRDRLATKGYPS